MSKCSGFMPYFDFSDLMPDDDYFYSSFEQECLRRNHRSVLIEWGASFPWTLDDRLALSEHIDEKTIRALSIKMADSGFSIIPVFPFAGGMEFLLSYPSYRHLRADDNCCVLNPESAGSQSLLCEIADDYFSLFGFIPEAVAFNFSLAGLFNKGERLKLASVLIDSFHETFSGLKNIIIAGLPGDKQLLERIAVYSNLKNLNILYLASEANNNGINTSGDIICHGAEKTDLTSFLLSGDDRLVYESYLESTGKAWEIIRTIKSELYRAKYSTGASHFNITVIIKHYNLLVEIFSEIGKTAEVVKKRLEGRANKLSTGKYFNSLYGVIKNELSLIEYDIENMFSNLKGG